MENELLRTAAEGGDFRGGVADGEPLGEAVAVVGLRIEGDLRVGDLFAGLLFDGLRLAGLLLEGLREDGLILKGLLNPVGLLLPGLLLPGLRLPGLLLRERTKENIFCRKAPHMGASNSSLSPDGTGSPVVSASRLNLRPRSINEGGVRRI